MKILGFIGCLALVASAAFFCAVATREPLTWWLRERVCMEGR